MRAGNALRRTRRERSGVAGRRTIDRREDAYGVAGRASSTGRVGGGIKEECTHLWGHKLHQCFGCGVVGEDEEDNNDGNYYCYACWLRERVLFIGTQFSILYTSVYPPAGAAYPRAWCL